MAKQWLQLFAIGQNHYNSFTSVRLGSQVSSYTQTRLDFFLQKVASFFSAYFFLLYMQEKSHLKENSIFFFVTAVGVGKK
jgi:hypothetical protein